MDAEFSLMFERDLVLMQHDAGDDGRGKNIPITAPMAEDPVADAIEEDYESSLENEEEEGKQLNPDTHLDEIFEGIDTPLQDVSETFTNGDSSKKLFEKIVEQMNYFFSNRNLAKDSYLMKKLMASENHEAPLKDFLQNPYIKNLTSDYAVLEGALKSRASELEVHDGMVRPLAKIPKHIIKRHSSVGCKVVINSLPSFYVSSIENLRSRLEQCGTLVDLQIYQRKEDVPKDLINVLNVWKHSSQCPFALAEYEYYTCAFKACVELTNTNDWRRGLKVELLMKLKRINLDKENKNTETTKQPKSKNKKSKKTTDALATSTSSPAHSPKTSSQAIHIPSSTHQNHNHHLTNSPLSKSYGTSPVHSKVNPRLSSLHGEAGEHQRTRSNSFGPLSSSPTQVPVKRGECPKRVVSVVKKPSNHVIREPRGPDGSKGFTLSRTLPVHLIPLPAGNPP